MMEKESKLYDICVDLLIENISITRYKDGGPGPNIVYPTLKEVCKELYPEDTKITFHDNSGYLIIYPKMEKIPDWYSNLRVERKHTTFIYNIKRGGIVDGSYCLTQYIYEENQIMKKSVREIAQLLLREMMVK